MARLVFKPYKNGLGGLGLVKEKLRELGRRVLEIKTERSRYKQKRTDVVIPWGVSKSKPVQFRAFNEHDVPTLETTTSMEAAEGWINDGEKVVCRTILNGHGGAGIVLAKTVAELVNAPLYTKYKKKQREFRVHCVLGNNEAKYYVTEKKRMAVERRPEDFNKYIRNHDNGWVFCRNTLADNPVPDVVLDASRKAVEALGLMFGAVDIGWHQQEGVAVYEVNTAPGADNETALWYANTFNELFQ